MKKISQDIFDQALKDHNLWLSDNTQGKQLILKNIDLYISGIKINSLNFKNAIFEDVSFPIHIENIKFINCKFYKCNIANADFLNTHFVECNIEKCYLYGAGHINSNTFKSCKFLENTHDKKYEQFFKMAEESDSNSIGNFVTPELKKLTREEFIDNYFKPHSKWLQDNATGKQLRLHNVDLSEIGVSLHGNYTKAIFHNVKFPENCSHIILNDADLIDCNFENVNLRRSQFKNSLLKNINFSQADLTDATFKNNNIQNININYAILDDNNKSYILQENAKNSTNLLGVDMTTNSSLQQTTGSENTTNNNDEIVYRKLAQHEVHYLYDNHALWLKNPAEGKQLDLSNCDLTVYGKLFLTNANFSKANLQNTIWPENCQNNNFKESNLKRAIFKKSTLGTSNFEGANLEGVNFNNSNLSDSIFSDTTIFANVKYNENTIYNDNFKLQEKIDYWTKKLEAEKQQVTPVPKQTSPDLKDSIMTANTTTPEVPTFLAGVLDQFKGAVKRGAKQGAAMQAAKILTKGTSKALIKAGVPKELINSKFGQMMISVLAPQTLAILTPHVPYLKSKPKLQLAISAALEASISNVVDKGLGKMIGGIAPFFEPMLKELMSVDISAIEVGETSNSESTERVIQVD